MGLYYVLFKICIKQGDLHTYKREGGYTEITEQLVIKNSHKLYVLNEDIKFACKTY